MSHPAQPLTVRLVGSYEVMPNGCWRWSRALDPQGYGTIRVARRNMAAHRAAWIAWRGPVPEGLCVLHRCDNPPCVNPDHLFLGTRGDNSRDMVAKGRSAFGERQGHSRLTAADVAEIRRLVAAGELTQREIGARYGVRDTAVCRIASGKRWGRLAGESSSNEKAPS
jgi:hypothetical protein